MVEAERWVALTVARTEYREVSCRFRVARLGLREGAAMIRGGKMDIPTAQRLKREGIRTVCGRFCEWVYYVDLAIVTYLVQYPRTNQLVVKHKSSREIKPIPHELIQPAFDDTSPPAFDDKRGEGNHPNKFKQEFDED